MFQKRKLRKQIKQGKATILALEQKRSRSQAELLSALMKNDVPKDEDVDYFNRFSELIECERKRLRELISEYEALSKK